MQVTRMESDSRAPLLQPPATATAPTWFTWVAVGLAAWLVSGAHLDAWAHRHLRFETFFTPWHAVLYSGWFLNLVFFAVMALRWRRQGLPWSRALPAGYGLSLAGSVAFGVGGALDLAWHSAFGIERSFSGDMSPTHLFLMIMAGVILAGPLRAEWLGASRRAGLPAVLSATFVLAMLSFWAQFVHPFIVRLAAAPQPLGEAIGEQLGVLGVLLHTALLAGVVLALLGRFRLPPGSLTIIVGLSAVFITIIERLDWMVPLALLAGAIGDLMVWSLRPSPRRPGALRLFAFLFPAALYLLYFIAVVGNYGTWWPVHVWTGSIALAGLTGYLLSLLVVPLPSRVATRP